MSCYSLRTGCFGTHVGLSPLLILSISSARSLVCVLPSLYVVISLSGSDVIRAKTSETGRLPNPIRMLSSPGFRIVQVP